MSRLIALFALLLFAGVAHAQSFPALSGRVVDGANLLSPAQEADLTAKLAELETKNRRQLVVVTLPSLQNYEIADYGYRLGRAWGIGEKRVNSGALLIVAPNERKVRIEVGYGLEPILTDALSSVIIQRQILPAFRKGDMGAGIVAGTDALVALLALPDEQAEARAQRIVAEAKQGEGGHAPVSLIFWGIIFLFVIVSMMRNAGGRRYARGGGLPVMIWGPGFGGGGGGGSSWGGGGGGFSGGGGSFGGGGASGSW